MSESWYCRLCNVYDSLEKMKLEHMQYGHKIMKRTPLKDRIITDSKGHIYVTIKKEVYGIIPMLCVFHDVTTNIEGLSFPKLSLQSVKNRWQFLCINMFSGSLKNLSRKLSYCFGQQTHKISEKQLENLFIKAILKDRVVETSNPNIIKVYLALNTDLKGRPPSKRSKFIVVTPYELKKLRVDAGEAEQLARKRMVRMNEAPVVGA